MRPPIPFALTLIHLRDAAILGAVLLVGSILIKDVIYTFNLQAITMSYMVGSTPGEPAPIWTFSERVWELMVKFTPHLLGIALWYGAVITFIFSMRQYVIIGSKPIDDEGHVIKNPGQPLLASGLLIVAIFLSTAGAWWRDVM